MRTSIKTHLDRIRTEPGLKKNVIAVTSLVVVALMAGGWILSNQRFTPPWADKYELSAEFEAVPGIAPGNGQEVRIAGVVAGQISGARVNENGRAELQMRLEPGHTVYDNAKLVLRPKSPLNEMYVTIDPGGPPGKPLPSGATIPVTNTERPVQVDEVLGALDGDARAALTTLLQESDAALAGAPRHLPQGLEGVADTTTELGPVVAQLDERRAKLRRLVTAVSQISSVVGKDDRRLLDLANSLDSTLGVLADGNSDLDATLAQLPEVSARLDRTTAAITRLSGQLDPALREIGAASETLPEALRKVSDTADALAETVDVATPTLQQARPVVADLRPFSRDARVALPRLHTSTARLGPVTATLLPYLADVGAFFVNTRSLTSMRDANGGILRGMLEITSTTLPTNALGGLSPDEVSGPTR